MSNWVLRRDDQIGCMVFWLVDTAESGHRDAVLDGSGLTTRPDVAWLRARTGGAVPDEAVLDHGGVEETAGDGFGAPREGGEDPVRWDREAL